MESSFKRPESVLVIVYTVGGDVLVMRRSQPADFWQSVTGSLNWHETDPLQTARRELAEETGLHDVEVMRCHVRNRFPIASAWQHRYAPTVRENTEYVFRVALPARRDIVLNPEEHTEYMWLTRHDAAARVSSHTNQTAILQWVCDAA